MELNRIKELRTAAGMKQEDLARRLKVSRQSISNYENSIRQLDLETIEKLCRIFGCTADYLLGLSSRRSPGISEDDAALLDAYHAASPKDRRLVDDILEEYKEKESTAAG